ncbi:vacuolar proton-inorganic pyrophosphatase [Tanacetum coccineum]
MINPSNLLASTHESLQNGSPKMTSPMLDLETVDHDVNDAIGKEFDVESGTIDEPEEPEEISDMFAKLDKALDELDHVIEAKNITELFAIYDQATDDVGDVVPVDVVAEEMVAKEVVDGDDSEQVVYDMDVIPDGLYTAIVAQKGVFSTDDGDVIPYEVVDEVLKQKGVWIVDDGDVIPDEVVAEKMLEDHTRLIKRKRVMADKENEDDSQ